MIAEDKILALLRERGGEARRSDLALLNISPQVFDRVLRKLLLEGKIEQKIGLTESGWQAKPKEWRRRQSPKMPEYGLIKSPPQHVFKVTTEEDITRIREEALSARELAG